MDDLVGRPVLDLYADTPEGKAKAEKVFGRFRAGREIRGEELEMRRVDGTHVWISLSVRPMLDAEGQAVASRSMVVDISERKRAEEALRRAREELEGKVEHQMVRKNPYGLTFREFTVLHLMAAGRADKEIADGLGISVLTASKHVANILGKMDAPSRTEASVRAVREGLLD
jgi:DNA-binding CsgD family transcriptional regulator